MSDLRELYQEVILDHNKRPRNFHAIDDANRRAEGYNPLCGDRLTVFVKLDGDRIEDASFLGSGCAISKASASMMTAELKGKTVGEAESLFRRFHAMVTAAPDGVPAGPDLGKLAVFSGVCEFPVRVKCASLPWHTMHSALQNEAEPVSTE
jgi:nitrogen fixation NifU-like protein